MIPNFAFEADTIEIIDALTEEDLQTARRIYNHIQDIQYEENAVQCPVQHNSVHSVSQFTDLLAQLSDRTKLFNKWPILHIECHGVKDGLCVDSEIPIRWADLAVHLRLLNRATRNNLLVVIGACEAFNGIKTLAGSITEGVAFRILVGPTDKVEAGKLEDALKRFYEVLLKEKDLTKAIKAAREKEPSIQSYSAEKGFMEAFQSALTKQRKQGKKKRVEKLVTDAKSIYPDLVGVPAIYQIARRALKEKSLEEMFDARKRAYFMIDDFPEVADTTAEISLDAIKSMPNPG